MSVQLPVGYWLHEQDKKIMEQLDREWQDHFNTRLWWPQVERGLGLLAQMSEEVSYKHDPATVLDAIEKLNNK